MKKTVALKGMQFFAHHGYYEAERETGNRYEVDVEIHYTHLNVDSDILSMPQNHISQVINYEDIAAVSAQVMSEPTPLLETLAQTILEKLSHRFDGFSPQILVKVRKFNPPLGILCAYSEVGLQNF